MNPFENYQNFNKNYNTLSQKIDNFNDVQSQLKEGRELLKAVREKVGTKHELYLKFEKQYKELYQTIFDAINSEKTFSTSERAKIKAELSDIVLLAQQSNITESSSIRSTLGNIYKGTSPEKAKKEIEAIFNKNIQSKNWTKEEILIAIRLLQSKDFPPNGISSANKQSILNAKTPQEKEAFQKILVTSFFQGKTFLPSGEILLSTPNGVPRIGSADEVARVIKGSKRLFDGTNVSDGKLSTESLSAYIGYLESKNTFSKSELIVNSFGHEKTAQLITFIKNTPSMKNQSTILSQLETANKINTTPLLQKNINTLSQLEAKALLEATHRNYGNYEGVSNPLQVFDGVASVPSMDKVKTKQELNVFQEKLIEKVIGKNGFNSNYITGFDSKKGNYILSRGAFEEKLKNTNFSELNAVSLKTYIGYLQYYQNGSIQKYLAQTLTPNACKNMQAHLQTNSSTFRSNIFGRMMGYLEEGKKIIIQQILSAIDLFQETLQAKNSAQLGNIFKKAQSLPENEQKEYINKLTQDIESKNSQLRSIIVGALLDKKKSLKEANALTDALLTQIKSNLTPEKLKFALQAVDTFNKEHKILLSGKKVVTHAIEVKSAENKKDSAITTKKISELGQLLKNPNLSKKEKDAYKKELQRLKQNMQAFHIEGSALGVSQKALEGAQDSDVKKLINGSLDVETLITQSPELKKEYETYKKEKKDFQSTYNVSYESTIIHSSEPPKKNIATKNDSPRSPNSEARTHTEQTGPTLSHTHTYNNGETLNYITTGENIKILSQQGDIQISHEEFDIIKSNPKAKENLFEFQNILKELNLEEVGKWRKDIFQSLSNKYPITFDMKDDFLNARELKIFLTTVMRAVGVEIDANLPINDMKKKIHTMNKEGAIFKNTQVSHLGGIIESHFQKTFIKNGTFQSYLFQEKI